mmetsp:Transcript_83536/g.150716  ORF Transcript_83536/g.150716 Transcript_83536/m.150716 type:complete len:281 (-) Transcript_83536:46-888(-)|eukprot:CAMPEP_0115067224 /NCGR_PEP_ID=MMETSP0227-20121206/11263_1 /TAXON_ID=89957 /ORGANISM="Polarella glacialis, Strain CCMP 1383" /LENGTH=280 /DNA_ID=CAMNT_0002453251 /DNA_START=90 /DNA_END=932 /DNA_ORIENTATION=+
MIFDLSASISLAVALCFAGRLGVSAQSMVRSGSSELSGRMLQSQGIGAPLSWVPPVQEQLKKNDFVDCWEPCRKRAGMCDDFCGAGNACCRKSGDTLVPTECLHVRFSWTVHYECVVPTQTDLSLVGAGFKLGATPGEDVGKSGKPSFGKGISENHPLAWIAVQCWLFSVVAVTIIAAAISYVKAGEAEPHKFLEVEAAEVLHEEQDGSRLPPNEPRSSWDCFPRASHELLAGHGWFRPSGPGHGELLAGHGQFMPWRPGTGYPAMMEAAALHDTRPPRN